MKVYTVNLVRTRRQTLDVSAPSPHVAARIAMDSAGAGWVPTTMDDGDYESWDVIGRCESCRGAILTGDRYVTDADDLLQCEDCPAEEAAS